MALYTATYRLPDPPAARLPGARVAVVDDVINAGASVRATSLGLPRETVATREYEIWEPQRCPRCADEEPLQTP